MIIQVRGTSGSGKTTVVRRILDPLDLWEPHYALNRRRPLYYTRGKVAVLGSYENACGGCDTVGSARAVYELIQVIEYPLILCEGLLLSEDVKWSSQLDDLKALFLTTPLEVCLDRIRARRIQAGNEKPLNVQNTSRRVAVIERARLKLITAGARCTRCTVDQAVRLIRREIYALSAVRRLPVR